MICVSSSSDVQAYSLSVHPNARTESCTERQVACSRHLQLSHRTWLILLDLCKGCDQNSMGCMSICMFYGCFNVQFEKSLRFKTLQEEPLRVVPEAKVAPKPKAKGSPKMKPSSPPRRCSAVNSPEDMSA